MASTLFYQTRQIENCVCPQFTPNIDFLNEVVVGKLEYHSAILLTQFVFCPWCGNKLETKK